MNEQQTQDAMAYKDVILQRLVEHYLTHAALPDQEAERVTLRIFHRLYRAVLAEGYGG